MKKHCLMFYYQHAGHYIVHIFSSFFLLPQSTRKHNENFDISILFINFNASFCLMFF